MYQKGEYICVINILSVQLKCGIVSFFRVFPYGMYLGQRCIRLSVHVFSMHMVDELFINYYYFALIATVFVCFLFFCMFVFFSLF